MKFEFAYSVAELDVVMRHWAEDFSSKKGIVTSTEWWIDPTKGQVMFRIGIQVDGAKEGK